MTIHPTALVDSKAQLDSSVEVGPWCVVGPHVRIGRGSVLKSHVVVEGHTEIGEDNQFFPFSVIGAVPQDLKYRGEPTRVVIGHRNVIREGVTINLGTEQGGGVTQVGHQTLIMAYSHLGHDCIIGDRCIIANYGGLSGHVILENDVILGGMTGVSQFVRVGAHAYIGGYSGLERDIPPFAVALGNRPCMIKGINRVGLKRRGFASEVIHHIHEAIKLWSRPDVSRDQCLEEIEKQHGSSAEVQQLLHFVRHSEVGVLR